MVLVGEADEDVWHLTAPIGKPEQGAYHAVSTDGLNFTHAANIPSIGGANWTGNLALVDGAMRFYGGSRQGLFFSETKDGQSWSDPMLIGKKGGDPAVVQTGRGGYLLIFVGLPHVQK